MTAFEEILAGLKILSAYGEGADNFRAEHDQIWAGPDADKVDAADAGLLEAFGWFVDEESWSRYV